MNDALQFAPVNRYVAALNAEALLLNLTAAVEALQIGVYRCVDGEHLLVAHRPLGEEEGAGWTLLSIDDAVIVLQVRALMVMGVWN